MTKQKRDYKAILLRISIPLFEDVEMATHEQNVTRTQFLRQSIQRNVDHFEKSERSIYQHLNGQEYL